MIKLLNNRISMVAFVWENGLFSPVAASWQRRWFTPLRACRAEPSHGFGEQRNQDTHLPLSQRRCGHRAGLTCSDVSRDTSIIPCAEKNEVEDVKPHASRKTQFRMFSELWRRSCYDSEQFLRRVKKFPRLNIIYPLFTRWWLFLENQSMQTAWL